MKKGDKNENRFSSGQATERWKKVVDSNVAQAKQQDVETNESSSTEASCAQTKAVQSDCRQVGIHGNRMTAPADVALSKWSMC